MKNIFIALFHVLDYLDQFKAIKENLLKGVGHLRTPTYLMLSQKPQFVVFLGAKAPLGLAHVRETRKVKPKKFLDLAIQYIDCLSC